MESDGIYLVDRLPSIAFGSSRTGPQTIGEFA